MWTQLFLSSWKADGKSCTLPSAGLHSYAHLNFTFRRQQRKQRSAKRTPVLLTGLFRDGLLADHSTLRTPPFAILRVSWKWPLSFPSPTGKNADEAVQSAISPYKMVSSTGGMLYSFQETDSKVDMARDGVFPSWEQKWTTFRLVTAKSGALTQPCCGST